jgi:hypothetical protein
LLALTAVTASFSPLNLPPPLSFSFLPLFIGFSPPSVFLVLLDTVTGEISYRRHLVRCYCYLSQFSISQSWLHQVTTVVSQPKTPRVELVAPTHLTNAEGHFKNVGAVHVIIELARRSHQSIFL